MEYHSHEPKNHSPAVENHLPAPENRSHVVENHSTAPESHSHAMGNHLPAPKNHTPAILYETSVQDTLFSIRIGDFGVRNIKTHTFFYIFFNP